MYCKLQVSPYELIFTKMHSANEFYCYTCRWDIPEQALKINASLRVCQLARPRSRNMAKDDDFDPYFVPKAARHATITPRVEELAIPLPRKVRSKKAA